MIRTRTSVILLASALFSLGCKKNDPPTAHQKEEPASPERAGDRAPAAKAQEAEPRAAEPPPLERKKWNVILLTIDALRADMPWTGYPKQIAPNLTKLAEESIVYENYRSISSYTAQTVATMLSGRYASTLYRTGTFFTNYSLSNDWISESMQAKGARTMAVHAHLYFDRAPGLKQGFDIWKMVPGLSWNAQTDESITTPRSFEAITELLSDPKNTSEQFFLWSHLMDPHDQYVKHEETPDFGKDNRGRYDSEVFFVDRHVGEFLEFAKKQPYWDSTAILISADHGEAFGEHGMYKHAFELWEVLTRIPLIVHLPGVPARRIAAGRTHIDLAPTILELMGIEPIDGFQGKSMVPELYGAEPESREPLFLELAEDTNNAARRAVVSGHYKLIVFDSGKKVLFDLESDPGELTDKSKDEPEKVKELAALIDEKFKELPVVKPYGGSKLKSGKSADGPTGPNPKTTK